MLRPAVVVLLAVAVTVGVGVTAVPAAAATPEASTSGLVLIDELANGDPESVTNSFAELRNWGHNAVDLTGWRLYRCNERGLRNNVDRIESDLAGIVLEPGEVLTLGTNGVPGALHIAQPFPLGGFGLYLEAPGGVLADRVGVFPNQPWPMLSECTPPGGNLPNMLIVASGESWQRIGASGDIDTDWQILPSTRGEGNAGEYPPQAEGDIVVSELTGAGPSGRTDDFFELRNDGNRPTDISGWRLDRCTALGRILPAGGELLIADGTVLAPGDSWVAGGPGFDGQPDARFDELFGDVEFGVLLRDADGRVADRVAVSHYDDSSCQGEGAKLPAILDAASAESWQLGPDGWIVARRTPGSGNATLERSVFRADFGYPPNPRVAISEIATDPAQDLLSGGMTQQNWIEVGNYGDDVVDIGGWTVRRCTVEGVRALEPQFVVPDGTHLAPGEVYLAARAGTDAAGTADVTYGTALNFLGTGTWLEDSTGRRVDSVGIYAMNEMDRSLVTPSPCTKVAALSTSLPDRMLAETYQRTAFTGIDADDFITGPGTPGVIDEVVWTDPTLRVETVEVTQEDGRQTALPVAMSQKGDMRQARVDVVPVTILDAWGGSSSAPLAAERGDDERELDPVAPGVIEDAGYAFPYHRLVIDASALGTGSTISWAGVTGARHEVQLSVWNAGVWRLVGTASADPETGTVQVAGTLEPGDIREREVTLLVQDGPRTVSTIASGIDGRLQAPADYDLAISHITDTQYMTEDYPQYYAQVVSWIADNADDRKIAFASHTGDIVQNWVDPDQPEDRARREFERASAIQAILDDAGVPNSVLPGNHDSKRGLDRSLFNEYFPVSRYAEQPWYGGSIAPDDNSANFSTFERAGAKFLMLSLPYAYGDVELAWANEVVRAHPDYNVVISTHEYMTAKTQEWDAERSTSSRWVSRGDRLWDEVVAPNRNVVVVLAGHFHGVGQITTEDAGGIEGHTVVEMLADYQEFRTHTGERGTGFQRLLQVDLASGMIAVDTFSVRLAASASYPYDYQQFLPDSVLDGSLSNARPWNIVAAGLQERYTAEDDEFAVTVSFQYAKTIVTTGVTAVP